MHERSRGRRSRAPDQRDSGAKSGAMPGVLAAQERNLSPDTDGAPAKRPLTLRSRTSGMGTGTIVVNRIHDPDLLLPVESETGAEQEQARLVSLMMGGGAFARPPQPRLYLGDTVVAINGAPLGWVTDHQVLADKVGPLERPVKVTFRREYVDNYLPATDPEPLRAAPQDLKV